jgi:hypothetical protein
MIICDGLKHLPSMVAQVWPQTIVQACIVHYADTRIMPIGMSLRWSAPLHQVLMSA